MLDFLFNTERYMPHGYCFAWQQELVWMHVVSDIAIALAYYSIPAFLFYLVARRKQSLPFKWVFVMFGLFILLCGTSHLIELITLWHPYYYLEGVVKVLTAAVSVATAVLLVPLIPKLLEIFSEIESSNNEEHTFDDESKQNHV